MSYYLVVSSVMQLEGQRRIRGDVVELDPGVAIKYGSRLYPISADEFKTRLKALNEGGRPQPEPEAEPEPTGPAAGTVQPEPPVEPEPVQEKPQEAKEAPKEAQKGKDKGKGAGDGKNPAKGK